jgi:uncharacterized protein
MAKSGHFSQDSIFRPGLWRVAVLAALVGFALVACDKDDDSGLDRAALERAYSSKPNPASLNCKKAGGILTIEKRSDGGEYGVCNFKNGLKCEEWAMLVGYCPPGGVDVSELPTDAARYCVLHGGRYHPQPWGSGKSEMCELPGQVLCSVDDFYSGRCGKTVDQALGQ